MNARKADEHEPKTTVIGRDLIKTKEAAEMIGITTSCFRYHARHGRIVAATVMRLGKCAVPFYRLEDVERLRDTIRKDGVPGRGRPRATDYANQ